MDETLKQLMQRKEELLKLKRKVERSKPALNPKEFSERANALIEDSDNDRTKDANSVSTQKSESAVSFEECFHEEIADTIEDSDTEGARFDVTSFITEKSHLLRDTINSSNSSAAVISEVDNSSFKESKNFVVNNSSDSSDILNTSTISLEMSHSFFNDSGNNGTLRIPGIDESISQETPKKKTKINIVSIELIDDLNARRHNERKYHELHSKASLENANKLKIPSTSINNFAALDFAASPCDNTMSINLPKSPRTYTALDIAVSSCDNIMPMDLPKSSRTNLALALAVSSCDNIMSMDLPKSPRTNSALDLAVSSCDNIMSMGLPKSPRTYTDLDIGTSSCCDNIMSMDLPKSPRTYTAMDIASSSCCDNIMSMGLPKSTSPNTDTALDCPTSSRISTSLDSQASPCADITNLVLPASPCVELNKGSYLHGSSSTGIAPSLGRCDTALSSDDINENTSKLKIKKSRKRKCKEKPLKFKKEHVDFMSDDEVMAHQNKIPEDEDFSSGSSELWSEKESDILSDLTDEKEREKTKKTRKKLQKKKNSSEKLKGDVQFKKNKTVNKRKIRKTKREQGDSYETSSGNIKAAKKLQTNPCKPGKCPRNCFDITDERRQNLFNFYWNLEAQRKKDWIVQCAHRVPVKRPRVEVVESKRKVTFEYYINEGEGRKQVCQKFILQTLDITQNFLLYTLSNVNEGLSQEEHRKKTTNSKYDETVVASARTYIESLPFLPSHYCRKDSSKLYLPQEYKNATNLYRLYRKFCEEKQQNYLGERKFKDLFKMEYNNITVHVPKKDKCKICAKIENNSQEANAVVDSELIKAHIEEKEATYERFQYHQKLHSIDSDTQVSSFDLQKVLNTPHGDNILLFYSRKYTVYNFTVYESSTQNGYCYTWGESDGKRGAKEIGSCILKYLQNVDDRGIKKVLFYCDCCSGQNRNKTILSIFQYFLTVSKNIEVIQINYLLPGHSYMPVDSMHSVIEREVRKLTVWSPTQWPSYMESARKNPRPYNVCVLEHKDFIDWDPVTQECLPPSTKNLQMSKIRIATIKKKQPSASRTRP